LKELYYIFVPTITPDVEELNEDILKKMALELNSDFATLKQIFAGSGIGCLRRTGDKQLAISLVESFKQFKIPFAAVSYSVLQSTPVFKAHKIKFEENGFFVTDDSLKNHFFSLNTPLIIGTDTGLSKNNLKPSLIKSKYITVADSEKAVVIEPELTTFENLEKFNKYSKVNNAIEFIEELVGKSEEIYFNRAFNSLRVQLDNNYKLYSALLVKAVKKQLYKGLPEKYMSVKKEEVKKHISYNYTIYRNLALFKKKLSISKQKAVLSPFNMFVIAGIVFLLIFSQAVYKPLLVLSALAFTVGFVLHFFKLSKLKNLIIDLPTSKLRSVAAGLVEVKGRITANEVFISPISGAECVFFRYRKYKKVRSRDREYWTISEMGEGIPSKCYIDDGTGIIGLNLKAAEIKVKKPEKYTMTYKEMEMGFVPNFFSNVKYEEEIIQTGESVYVLGTARPESKSKQFGSFLAEAKKNPYTVQRFDMDGNGVLDSQEWEAAIPDLKNDFRKKVLEQGQSFGLILDRDKHNNLLVVATEKEENLIKKLKWRIPFYLVLGMISFLFLIISVLYNL